MKDTACVDACPVDCIHPKKSTTYDDGRPSFDEVSQLYIDPIESIECGACVPVCPVSTIFALDDLPEKWKALYGDQRKLRPRRQIHSSPHTKRQSSV
ncbi:MAG: ferredoxin family protein [Terriglobales bacterium]